MDWKHIATLSEREQMRAWVEHWKRLGPELDKLKRQELRALTEEERIHRAVVVMNSRPRHARESPKLNKECGLVEQQRHFASGRA